MKKSTKAIIGSTMIAASAPVGSLAIPIDTYTEPTTFDEAKTNLKVADENLKKANTEYNSELSTNKNLDIKLTQTKNDFEKAKTELNNSDMKSFMEELTKSLSDEVENLNNKTDKLKSNKSSVEEEILNQEKNVEKAQADVITAESELEKIKGENPNIDNELSEAEKKVNDDQTKVNKNTEELNDLKSQKEAKQTELTEAQNDVNNKQAELDSANSQLANVESNLSSKSAEVTNAENRLNELTKDNPEYQAALNNLNNAKNALSAAQASRDSAQSEVNTATNALNEAKSRLKTLQSQSQELTDLLEKETAETKTVESLTEEVNQKESDKNNITSSIEETKTKLDSAKANLTTEKAKLETLKTEKQSLEEQIAQKEKDLQKANEVLTNIKEDTKRQAKEKYDKGSMGFFESMNSTAVQYFKEFFEMKQLPNVDNKYSITGDPYDEESLLPIPMNVHNGKDYSPTNLEHMKTAIECIKMINNLRRQGDDNFAPKNYDLKIRDSSMAAAQVHGEVASHTIDHWYGVTRDDHYGDPTMYRTTENIAWGYNKYDFLKGWYNEEKAVFDNIKNKLGISGRVSTDDVAKIYEYFNKMSNEDKKKMAEELGFPNSGYIQIGHYTNLFTNSPVIGFAFHEQKDPDQIIYDYRRIKEHTGDPENVMYGKVHLLQFGNEQMRISAKGGSVKADEELYTIEEYTNRFDNYYNDLKSKMENGDPLAIQAAQESVSNIKNSIKNLKSQLDSKNSEITSKEKDVEDSQKKVNDCEASLNKLNAELEKATTDLNSSIEKLDTATQTLNNTKKEIEDFYKTNPDIKEKLQSTLNEIESLKNELNTKQTALEQAKEKVSEKQKEVEIANEKLKELDNEIAEANETLERLRNELSVLKTERDNLSTQIEQKKEKLKELKENVSRLNSDLENLESSITDKTRELSQHQSSLNEALSALNEVKNRKAAVDSAEEKLEEAKNSANLSQSKLRSLRENLKNLEDELNKTSDELNKAIERSGKAEKINLDDPETYVEFPEVTEAVERNKAAQKRYDEISEKFNLAKIDLNESNNRLEEAKLTLKEMQFRYDRALNDYNRLKPHVKVASKETTAVSNEVQTNDTSNIFVSMSLLAIAGIGLAEMKRRTTN